MGDFMRRTKKIIAYALVIGIFVIASIKIYFLNTVNRNYYTKLLSAKQEKIITLASAPRGRILDRNGNILVDNIGVKTIVYKKNVDIKPKDEITIARRLADILNMEYTEKNNEVKEYYLILNQDKTDKLITKEEYEKVQNRKLKTSDLKKLKLQRITEEMLSELDSKERLAAHIYALMNKGYKYEVKTIKDENVTEEEYAQVVESNIQGVTGSITWERTYPYGSVLKNILGSVSSSKTGIPSEVKDEYLKKGYSLNDRVGISYLEKEYEEYLKGQKATYKVNSDNTLTLLTPEKRGNDLVLAIDINMQMDIEKIMEEKILAGKKLPNTEYYNHAYVIVSNPIDGSIIAFAGKRLDANTEKFSDINENIITSAYTVGSVVKGASQTVGYKNNLIIPDGKVVDSCVKLHFVPEKCSFKRLGVLTDITALKWSSNYYQFLTAIKSTGKAYHYNMDLNVTGADFKRYRDIFAQYGLGVKTEIDLPNEQIGLIGSKVADDLLLNLAIGQYDTYTPIELVQYINTIASNGQRKKLSLMQKVVDENGKTVLENKGHVLNEIDLDSYYFARIKEGFRQVIDGGTGRGYTDLKWNPAGKTGTSESFYDSDNDGVADVKTITMSYAMFAPLDNPKYSLVVISPNVSHENGKTEYTAYINKHISTEVSKILFENY